jgi:hypothetical protein
LVLFFINKYARLNALLKSTIERRRMNISIQDMQMAAGSMGPPIQISSEIGNVIEINDMNDDLGFNMLANQSRSRDQAPQSFGSSPIRLSAPDQAAQSIQFDTLEPIELNAFGSNSGDIPAFGSNSGLSEISITKESSPYDNNQTSSSGPSISLTPAPPRDFEAETQ